MPSDYYSILQLNRTASAREIKLAYRRLAMAHHPDRNQGDAAAEERFKLISEAYETLADDGRRAAYDAQLQHQDASHSRPVHADRDMFHPEDEDLAEFMRGFYAPGTEEAQAQRGCDVRLNLKIAFRDAALGTETMVSVPVEQECPQCGGTGLRAGGSRPRCPHCGGTGTIPGRRGIPVQCPVCGGKGAAPAAGCPRCAATGRLSASRQVRIVIPPGVETGTRLRVAGGGAKGAGGAEPGDFVVVLQVADHPLLERCGNDLRCAAPLPYLDAILGCRIAVPALDGQRILTVPQGTVDGRCLRIRGQGLRVSGTGRRGDLIVQIRHELPTTHSREELRLLKQARSRADSQRYPVTCRFRDLLADLK